MFIYEQMVGLIKIKYNDKEIDLLTSKFKSNKFGSNDKIFQEINNLYNQKNITSKSLFYDEMKNEK